MTDHPHQREFPIADANCYTKIKYKVRAEGGPVLKGALQPEIMDFVTGFAQVVPGLEKRLIGHCVGEKMSFTVPAEEAFGPKHQELIIEKPKSDFHFPAGMKPYPGMELPLITGQPGTLETAVIRAVKDDSIVIDANHPLSGVALQYELEIIEARPAGPNDVCAEWEPKSAESCCSGKVATIVCGADCGSDCGADCNGSDHGHRD